MAFTGELEKSSSCALKAAISQAIQRRKKRNSYERLSQSHDLEAFSSLAKKFAIFSSSIPFVGKFYFSLLYCTIVNFQPTFT